MIFLKFIISLLTTLVLIAIIMRIDEKRNDIFGHHTLCRFIFLLEVLIAAVALLRGKNVYHQYAHIRTGRIRHLSLGLFHRKETR